MTEVKNQTWRRGFTLSIEHLNREQMRELQLRLAGEGWAVKVTSE